jgi:hypothetical protein
LMPCRRRRCLYHQLGLHWILRLQSWTADVKTSKSNP